MRFTPLPPLRPLLGAAALAVAAQAAAHATLTSAMPASGALLASPPAEVALRFDEAIEESFSRLTVSDASGKAVGLPPARVDPADRHVLRLALPPLAPGSYSVHWVVVGHDGHRRGADYRFTVK